MKPDALCSSPILQTRYPLHELAPMAQWWVADHYFRLGDSVNAEQMVRLYFQNTNWQNSSLPPIIRRYSDGRTLGSPRAQVLYKDIRDYFQKPGG